MRKKVKLLLVEDSEDHIFFIKNALFGKLDRYLEIDVATDGEAAIDYFQPLHSRGRRPDLIVLDLKLPKRNGFEVLQALKADKDLRSIPVVVFSSSERAVDVLKSYSLGANSYISKPVSASAFAEKIEQISNYWLHVSILPGLAEEASQVKAKK